MKTDSNERPGVQVCLPPIESLGGLSAKRGYALRLAGEKNVFIRKIIGWALRDYARWDPQAVSAVLRGNRERFSGLILHEAQDTLAPINKNRIAAGNPVVVSVWK